MYWSTLINNSLEGFAKQIKSVTMVQAEKDACIDHVSLWLDDISETIANIYEKLDTHFDLETQLPQLSSEKRAYFINQLCGHANRISLFGSRFSGALVMYFSTLLASLAKIKHTYLQWHLESAVDIKLKAQPSQIVNIAENPIVVNETKTIIHSTSNVQQVFPVTQDMYWSRLISSDLEKFVEKIKSLPLSQQEKESCIDHASLWLDDINKTISDIYGRRDTHFDLKTPLPSLSTERQAYFLNQLNGHLKRMSILFNPVQCCIFTIHFDSLIASIVNFTFAFQQPVQANTLKITATKKDIASLADTVSSIKNSPRMFQPVLATVAGQQAEEKMDLKKCDEIIRDSGRVTARQFF